MTSLIVQVHRFTARLANPHCLRHRDRVCKFVFLQTSALNLWTYFATTDSGRVERLMWGRGI